MPDFSKLPFNAKAQSLVREMLLDRAGLVTLEQNEAERNDAFKRGAEAMRNALLKRVSWGSDLADRIRAEPVPEDK
jgi:hypothetical protein